MICKSKHICYCGTADHTPHEIGQDGCVRRMEEPPINMENGYWRVGMHDITDFTLRQQRGYHQHECGCWSSWKDSVNSIEA